MITLIKKDKGASRKIGKNYQVVNFLTEEDCKNLSVAVSKAKNHNEKTRNTKSHRVYYVLKGKLTVKQGKKSFVAGSGDSIFIPRNTKYQFHGTFEAVFINSPAFNKKNELNRF